MEKVSVQLEHRRVSGACVPLCADFLSLGSNVLQFLPISLQLLESCLLLSCRGFLVLRFRFSLACPSLRYWLPTPYSHRSTQLHSCPDAPNSHFSSYQFPRMEPDSRSVDSSRLPTAFEVRPAQLVLVFHSPCWDDVNDLISRDARPNHTPLCQGEPFSGGQEPFGGKRLLTENTQSPSCMKDDVTVFLAHCSKPGAKYRSPTWPVRDQIV